MNVNELEKKFQDLNIDEKKYVLLTGELPDDSFCMEYTADGDWIVYYTERGKKFKIQHFSSENEACEYMCEKVLRTAHISL